MNDQSFSTIKLENKEKCNTEHTKEKYTHNTFGKLTISKYIIQ